MINSSAKATVSYTVVHNTMINSSAKVTVSYTVVHNTMINSSAKVTVSYTVVHNTMINSSAKVTVSYTVVSTCKSSASLRLITAMKFRGLKCWFHIFSLHSQALVVDCIHPSNTNVSIQTILSLAVAMSGA